MMKIRNILPGWIFLLASTMAIGQSLNQAEYFINDDPGVGNGTSLAITEGVALDDSFTFSTEGLAVGNHKLYVRTKEAGDRWSMSRAFPFYVQDTVKDVAFIEERFIVAAEYFIDTEPGAGSGMDIPVTTSGLVEESFTVSTTGLEPGEHTLFVRTQDDAGIWSLVKQMGLFIQDTVKFVPKVENKLIVAAEYFIDTTRAVGNGIAIPVTVGGEVSTEFTIQTAGLSNGEHKLYVRTQGNDGVWSLQKSMDFAVLPSDVRWPVPFFTADTVDTGQQMTLTNLSDSVDANTTYKWDVFDDGMVDFTTSDILFTFDTTGLIPVRLTAFNGADSSSYLGNVLVGDFTNINITASASTDLCEGGEVTLSAPADYAIYAWNTGDSTQTITVIETENYFAWLTDANGFTIKSAIKHVEVTAELVADVEFFDASTGMSNGFAKLVINDENASIVWSTGATDVSYISDLSAGSYSVDVSSGSCTETIAFTISEVIAAAGDLVAAEYFFDTDPGPGLATALNISNGQDISFAMEIPTDGLSLGNHQLHVRTLNNEGLWSLTNQMTIFIQDITSDVGQESDALIVAAEYYFDTDPGVGGGNTIAVSTPTASISENLSIDASGLADGVHSLYMRTKADNGIWSQSERMDFQNCSVAVDAPIVSDITICIGSNLVLEAIGAADHTYLWFDADSVMITGQTSSTYNLGVIQEDQVFYVAQKNAEGCQSVLARIAVTVPQFEVFAGLDFDISKVGDDFLVSSFYPANGVWSGTGISELGSIARANLNPGEYTYTYTIDTLDCSFTDTRVLTVLDFSETYEVTIPENQAANTVLQQIVLDDIQSYELATGELTAIAVDQLGAITILDSAYFDFEVNPTSSWEIYANQNEEFTYNVSLNVTLTDTEDPPVILDQAFSVNENSIQGSTIGTIVGADQDSPDLTYAIEAGNSAGAFSLESSTGSLGIADSSLFDFEMVTSYVLVVSVSDGLLSNAATITVTVNDVNESPVLTDQLFSIAENSVDGTSAGTVAATDPDGDVLAYSILTGNTNSAFAIGALTGDLIVANVSELDFETTPAFTLTVRVADSFLNTSAAITINLTDVDELMNQAPQISAQTFSLAENSANGTSVGTVIATDPDGDALTYSITSGNTNGAFAIDGTTGAVTVANVSALDFETNPTFTLTVEVADAALNASAIITINLTDVDESMNQAPQINAQAFSLAENSANGTSVGTVIATDPDGDALAYSITSGNTNDAFAIDGTTGAVTVANVSELDFETNPTFTLTVEVADAALNASATIAINLTDVDESANQAPQISAQTFSLAENSADGTSVGTIVASDPDGDALTYSITSGNTNGAFAVDGATGALTVANVSELDFETTPTFTLMVDVADAGLNASAAITINLTDVDESANQAPQISAQTFSLTENSENGTSVGTVVATDPDGDMLSYAIIGDNTDNAFLIDAGTGSITVGNVTALDFETTPTFELNVLVADASANASATITINLTDVDENALGLAEEVKSKMSIYPNPVVGLVTLEFPDELLKGEWTLMSLAGKELLHRKVDETKQEIDLSGFKNGLYFIQVNHDDISFSITLIKQ